MPHKIDVCLCEPFVLPGILPTLGVATIKAELLDRNIDSVVLYPSMKYFVDNALFRKPVLLSLIEDTPLQLVEYLFVQPKNHDNSMRFILSELASKGMPEEDREKIRLQLIHLRELALASIQEIIDQLYCLHPRFLCLSTTFGDLNFVLQLADAVKSRMPDIEIICGGSSCSPEYAQKLFSFSSSIDTVICDETGTVTTDYIASKVRNDVCVNDSYIATRFHPAESVYKLKSLDILPCPNFDDFFSQAKLLSLNLEMLTLPYEYARGCWWGEMHPCSMCGFFGTQDQYLTKNTPKVVSEIEFLTTRYNISRIRFTDLVNPRIEQLKELICLREKGLKVFWELRPDITAEQIQLLKEIGLESCQIGVESLSTAELKVIRKGTTGIQNIFALRLLSEYKVNAMWNYLYGFPEDQVQWYLESIGIIPFLYHLQPPIPRKIWINRYSQLFNSKDCSNLCPIGDNNFRGSELIFFYKAYDCPELHDTYQRLIDSIAEWNDAYSRHYSMLIRIVDGSFFVEVDHGRGIEKFEMSEIEAEIYCFFYSPHTMNDILSDDRFRAYDVHRIMDYFISIGIMIHVDGQYLALACFPTKYKWSKHYELPSYAGEKLITERLN